MATRSWPAFVSVTAPSVSPNGHTKLAFLGLALVPEWFRVHDMLGVFDLFTRLVFFWILFPVWASAIVCFVCCGC